MADDVGAGRRMPGPARLSYYVEEREGGALVLMKRLSTVADEQDEGDEH